MSTVSTGWQVTEQSESFSSEGSEGHPTRMASISRPPKTFNPPHGKASCEDMGGVWLGKLLSSCWARCCIFASCFLLEVFELWIIRRIGQRFDNKRFESWRKVIGMKWKKENLNAASLLARREANATRIATNYGRITLMFYVFWLWFVYLNYFTCSCYFYCIFLFVQKNVLRDEFVCVFAWANVCECAGLDAIYKYVRT